MSSEHRGFCPYPCRLSLPLEQVHPCTRTEHNILNSDGAQLVPLTVSVHRPPPLRLLRLCVLWCRKFMPAKKHNKDSGFHFHSITNVIIALFPLQLVLITELNRNTFRFS